MNEIDVVLDTNVIIAALRSRKGASWQILDMVRQGSVRIHVTVPLVLEYEDVLLRHRDVVGWTRKETLAFLGLIVQKAKRHRVYYLWRGHTRDPADAHVLEAAVAAEVEHLVTFNTRDLSSARRFGLEVLPPGEFLRRVL